jgi:hypothetical protein
MPWVQVITGLEVDDLAAVRVLGRRPLARTPRTPGETRRPAGGMSRIIILPLRIGAAAGVLSVPAAAADRAGSVPCSNRSDAGTTGLLTARSAASNRALEQPTI